MKSLSPRSRAFKSVEPTRQPGVVKLILFHCAVINLRGVHSILI